MGGPRRPIASSLPVFTSAFPSARHNGRPGLEGLTMQKLPGVKFCGAAPPPKSNDSCPFGPYSVGGCTSSARSADRNT